MEGEDLKKRAYHLSWVYENDIYFYGGEISEAEETVEDMIRFNLNTHQSTKINYTGKIFLFYFFMLFLVFLLFLLF